MTIKFAGVVVASLLLAAHATSHADAARPPNVIFILTDDQGWGDARFAGHPFVKTPNLDRLAKEGTWFRQFYVAATVCSPSRTAFMTAHCPARHLVHGHFSDHAQNARRSMPDWLNPDVTTLPDLLRQAGYATAHFGKWHLGSGDNAPPPEAYGIDFSKTVNSSEPSLGESGLRRVDARVLRERQGPAFADAGVLCLPHRPRHAGWPAAGRPGRTGPDERHLDLLFERQRA